MRLRLSMAVLVVAALGGPAAANPHLDEAREAKAVLDYDRALGLIDQALRWGDNDPEQLAAIYRLAGEVAAGLDRAEEAEMWFTRLLALEPGATLPAGTSPKITDPFERARAFIEQRGPLEVRYQDQAGDLVVVIERDPLDLVAGARLYYQTATGTLHVIEGRGDDRITMTLPEGSAYKLAAFDEHGNELVQFDLSFVVDVGPAERPGRGWWLAAGVTVASLGAGIYFGLDARDAEDDLAALNQQSKMGEIDASEAHALVRRGRRSATLANVGFVAAGIGAVITSWLVYRRLTAPDPTVAVTPVVGADGGGVLVRLAF